MRPWGFEAGEDVLATPDPIKSGLVAAAKPLAAYKKRVDDPDSPLDELTDKELERTRGRTRAILLWRGIDRDVVRKASPWGTPGTPLYTAWAILRRVSV